MRMDTPSYLNDGNLDQHENKLKERDEVFEELDIATQMFVLEFSSQLK